MRLAPFQSLSGLFPHLDHPRGRDWSITPFISMEGYVLHACMCVRVCVCVCVCVRMRVRARVCVCVCVRAHVHVHVQACCIFIFMLIIIQVHHVTYSVCICVYIFVCVLYYVNIQCEFVRTYESVQHCADGSVRLM